ncbi:GON-4-like protein [Cebidichthys violaceus]|uniref:GON-4-like protein n=1 Tax=Cebidichthys violaceus TaxID=271503 RepID=UPI0035CBA844
MATDGSLKQMERRRPAQEDICPLQSKSLRTDGETVVFKLDRKSPMSRTGSARQEEERTPVSGDTEVVNCDITMTREHVGSCLNKVWLNPPIDLVTSEASEDELGRLDIDLDRKSKQHNLTSSNVRAILHEVITHERVVAMMKAAIRDTQNLPMFEPKMTRSRLKQAVQQGQPLNWSLSALNAATVKPPQFVDIDLEEDEDSSDEEYCPDEEEEEEEDTAEESFLSDADSLASPLKKHQGSQLKLLADQRTDEPRQRPPEHLGEQLMTCAPHHLLTAPESSFLERLNAVEEELDCSPAYTYNQSLDRKADDDGSHEGSSCLAYRTRSKLRLVNVPLGQLEAALLAPDITADMYGHSAAQREEDRHWTKWLQGLMAPDSEEEADDDDDPEYNFLDDQDEPDLEDYRTDRAVQITKKEVNELLEELFDTLQEEEEVAAEEEEEEEEEEEQEQEEAAAEEDEEEEEDVAAEEEVPSQTGPKFNIPQALRFEAPLADMLTERRRTVRRRYEALQQKRALQDTTNHHRDNVTQKDTPGPQPDTVSPVLVLQSRVHQVLHLDYTQKLQLQQQIQQHVQLLTQVHLLCRHVDALNHETCITKHYLEELQQFASRREVFLPSSFRVGNLQEALDLLQEVEQRAQPPAPPVSAPPATSRRWLPRMTPATNSLAFPLLPADAAWLLATRPVFLYPELLPVCSLDPAIHPRHHRSVYTAGEDGLIVLGLKHFEGTIQSDQLISSYLLCKTRWNFRKHIREMSGPRAPHGNVIKMFLTQTVAPPLPLACSRVEPGDRRPPVDRNTASMPKWLKNSQLIIQKTRHTSTYYPPSLPVGCTLRLHPHWLKKSAHLPPPPHRRLFTLAHNASLPPLAKAPADRRAVDSPVDGQTARRSKTAADRQVDVQPIGFLSLPPAGVTLLSGSPAVALPPDSGAAPLAAVHTVPVHPVCADIIQSCLPIGRRTPLLLPALAHPDTANPTMLCSTDTVKPGYFVLQMVKAPPTVNSQHALGQETYRPIKEEQKEVEQTSTRPLEERQEESSASTSTLSPPSSCAGDEEEEEENWTALGVASLNGGENTGGEEEEGRDVGGAGGGGGGEEEAGGGGEGEEEEEEGQMEDGGGGGERDEDGEKEKDEDQDRPGEEEEEEDFDDLTQDEDEEEVMSSASEESVLSVPELQETMKQLTWLAAERRLCADGDSEEDHSPTSPGSQEEEEEEEEEGPKGEALGEGRSSKAGGDEETPSGEGTPRGGGGRCPGRGRGRSRPLRGLRRSRQERHSKDAAKLLLLYDENILNNDPHRESKDVAFAQSYLNRVREVLQDVPEQVEEFVSLLSDFEQVGDGQEVMLLFRKLRCILGDRTDLLRDFAAFLHPEQALQCGLVEEQQAFERSRRFLRQLEISFGDNPSHYQKIIKALQTGPDLSPTSIDELKVQMATLLKGHTHLQAEFWVFFDELRPPPARPGQFEEAHWPDEGGGGSDGGEGVGLMSGGVTGSGFEEVTLPELEEEEEGLKIQPMTSRRRRRKMAPHRDYKGCDWSDKDWPCLCRDAKIRGHRRKECSRCHGNKVSGGVSRAMKSLDPLYSQISSAHDGPGNKHLDVKGDDDSPQTERSGASWEGSFPLIDEEKEEEEEELDEEEEDDDEEERKTIEKKQSPTVRRSRREEVMGDGSTSSILPTPPFVTSSNPSSSTIPSMTSSSSTIPSMTSSTSSMIPSMTSSTSSMIPSMNSSTSSTIPSMTSSSSTILSMSSSSSTILSMTSSSSSIIPSMTSSTNSSMISTSSISSSIFPSTSVTSSVSSSIISPLCSSSISPSVSSSSSSVLPRPSPPPDLPVCAKNISLTASGEKVILWTREADRVILTMCQQEGANQNTFQAVSTLLGNKTPSEVSRRFRDLMRLFRTAARQTSSEDEAPPTQPAAANEEED